MPKAGSASEIIALPKNGGALHGIGKTSSLDRFAGTGNFIVPIALPPGRNGFQPKLNLLYSRDIRCMYWGHVHEVHRPRRDLFTA